MALTDDELKLALSHVLYEMEMLAGTSEILRVEQHNEVRIRCVKRNAQIESFIVHVRSLAEFFSPQAKLRPDDMRPEHFVSGLRRIQHDPDHIERMHKEVAHLTYRREPCGERQGWARHKTARSVALASLNFLSAIESQHADWLGFIHPGGQFTYRERIDGLRIRLKWAESDADDAEPEFDCGATAASAGTPFEDNQL
jgi:hypothetical protein